MTERRLYILRHAKSSWDDPGQPDHERPLAQRGRRTLAVIADYMSNHAVRPELVLCSSARRTRETCDGIGPTGQVLIERPLYDASCEQLIERLRRLPADTSSVMVVGHNPAMQMLALKLAGTRRVAASGQLAEIERKFPTGALATLSLQCGWGELAAGCAELVDYMRPKALLYR
jgi:phosphohistidine phosphatase